MGQVSGLEQVFYGGGLPCSFKTPQRHFHTTKPGLRIFHGKPDAMINQTRQVSHNFFRQIVHDLADVSIMNLDEARAISGRSEMEAVLSELRKVKSLIVITTGRGGCIVLNGKERFHAPIVSSAGKADTTGAGDAFAAGFIIGKLRNLDDAECAASGNKAASSFLRAKEMVG